MSKPCGRASSTSCCSGGQEDGYSERLINSAGRRIFSGTSLGTARTVIPGAISCKTRAKTRMAEKNPPVAGRVSGWENLASEQTARRQREYAQPNPRGANFSARATTALKACGNAATLRGNTRRLPDAREYARAVPRERRQLPRRPNS